MKRLRRKLVCALLLCLLVPVPTSCWAENLKVLVVLSDNSAPYRSFANVFNNSLPALMRATVLEHPEQFFSAVTQADLIVAVGMKATQVTTAQNSIPVIAAMIPQTSYEALLAQAATKKILPPISAIYLDQPWLRQVDFWRAALPERRRIGLLHSSDAHIDVARLRKDIAQRDGALVIQPVRSADELFSRLENVLANSDVLLATPDSLIYSSSNIRNILLTSYRYRVPLIGLSQAYVNAGALCAIFSTPEQLAAQAGAMVIFFARDRQLPAPQFPAAYTIAVNQQVARSLGIELSSPEAIRSQMDKMKEGRQ
jgi:putative ABC transport system substrate-binding protein